MGKKTTSSLNKIRCLLTFNNNSINITKTIPNKNRPKNRQRNLFFLFHAIFVRFFFSSFYLGYFTIQTLAVFIYFHFYLHIQPFALFAHTGCWEWHTHSHTHTHKQPVGNVLCITNERHSAADVVGVSRKG